MLGRRRRQKIGPRQSCNLYFFLDRGGSGAGAKYAGDGPVFSGGGDLALCYQINDVVAFPYDGAAAAIQWPQKSKLTFQTFSTTLVKTTTYSQSL